MTTPFKRTDSAQVRILTTAVIVGLVVLGVALVCLAVPAQALHPGFGDVANRIGWCCIAGGIGGAGLWFCLRRAG